MRDRPANEVPSNPRVIVTAFDSNLTRILSDPTGRAKGVVGGYGVFGATSTQHMPLPPPNWGCDRAITAGLERRSTPGHRTSHGRTRVTGGSSHTSSPHSGSAR